MLSPRSIVLQRKNERTAFVSQQASPGTSFVCLILEETSQLNHLRLNDIRDVLEACLCRRRKETGLAVYRVWTNRKSVDPQIGSLCAGNWGQVKYHGSRLP